jgi:NADPH:quinone reductase-like Zn-dependent oxidoreductase
MRALRFHAYGDPGDVLVLEEAPVPNPAAGQIRVKVHGCGLNPADWALCRGLFASELPRGVGLCVSGVVDTVGEGVTDVKVGDPVLGAADYSHFPSAGAAEFAILHAWGAIPPGLDLTHAAALPMAIETASRCLDGLDLEPGQTLLVHAAGTVIGFAAVQIGLMRGAQVVATAGPTLAGRIEALGVPVTAYGDGMVERVRALCGAPDRIFDAGPISPVLPDLVSLAGDADHVLTVSNHGPTAEALGVRNSFASGRLRNDALGELAALAAEGKFHVPVARTYPLTDWREAMELSLSFRAGGKLVLLP